MQAAISIFQTPIQTLRAPMCTLQLYELCETRTLYESIRLTAQVWSFPCQLEKHMKHILFRLNNACSELNDNLPTESVYEIQTQYTKFIIKHILYTNSFTL